MRGMIGAASTVSGTGADSKGRVPARPNALRYAPPEVGASAERHIFLHTLMSGELLKNLVTVGSLSVRSKLRKPRPDRLGPPARGCPYPRVLCARRRGLGRERA